MANSPESFRVSNPELGEEIIRAGQRLIEVGMGLRDVGFEVPVEYGQAQRDRISRAIDDSLPAYEQCVGEDADCPHHRNWSEELPELADAVASVTEPCTCDFPIGGHELECPVLVAEVDASAYEPAGDVFFERREAAWKRWATDNDMHYHASERDIFFDAYTSGFVQSGEGVEF